MTQQCLIIYRAMWKHRCKQGTSQYVCKLKQDNDRWIGCATTMTQHWILQQNNTHQNNMKKQLKHISVNEKETRRLKNRKRPPIARFWKKYDKSTEYNKKSNRHDEFREKNEIENLECEEESVAQKTEEIENIFRWSRV